MKGQKRSFRVISLILALALVLTMLPTTALAARTIDAGVFKNIRPWDFMLTLQGTGGVVQY